MSAVDPTAEEAALNDAGASLPEAAARRLDRAAFSSALTIPEFAACQHLGIRPVALVQGFCVMRWSWNAVMGLGAGTGYGQGYQLPGHRRLTSYSCPHGRYMMSADHSIYGFNDELTYMEQAWATGFRRAHDRMVAEAAEAGAHGVIGVIDATQSLIASDVREFHLLGTAVVLDGGRPPPHIWTTFLAGQRLAKLFEAGMVPLAVVGAFAAVTVWPVCSTEMLESGMGDGYGVVRANDEITQLSDAHMDARRVARDQARSQLGNDGLHGVDLRVQEGRVGTRALITASLQGTRVRQVHDVEPLPVPVPTLRLS